MDYSGPERRKYPRILGRFIVSYRIAEEADKVDASQTKNLSLGGMMLTTNRSFNPETNLILEIRLPFDPYPIIIVGKVIESREVIKDLIYDTRIQFLSVDERHKKVLTKTVDYYLKRDAKR